jgi:drug/metabolite transporter (DMT)-like permease
MRAVLAWYFVAVWGGGSALAVEGFDFQSSFELWAVIACLVIFASLLAVSVLHSLMRHGEATRVASMLYLPPVFAVALELAWFGVVPSALALAGIAPTPASP